MDVSRLDTMPPRAPAEARKGGTSASRAGNEMSERTCFSSRRPATRLSSPATTTMGRDSRSTSVSSASPDRSAQVTATAATTTASTVTTSTTTVLVTTRLARYSAGSVTMSPLAVTSGAITLSGSQSRRAAVLASVTVSTASTIDDSRPPSTEMVTYSATEMVSATPKPSATSLAMPPSTTDVTRVSTPAASRFWPSTPSPRMVDR